MDAPERGALMLVRFVAVALMFVTLVEIVLYLVVSSAHHAPVEIFPCVLKSIPFVLGVVILIKSKSLAAWVSEKLE
jgi:hypothetical protein